MAMGYGLLSRISFVYSLSAAALDIGGYGLLSRISFVYLYRWG